ncbi:MAG: EAL domain-containing protein (putative c-di-GMP-specific phosphodiesterase class I), partial [Acidimicrobiales bacterium]
ERSGRAERGQALRIIAERIADLFRRNEDAFWRGDGNRILVATSESLADGDLERRINMLGALIKTDAFEHEPTVTVAAVDLDPSLNTSAAVLQRLQIALSHGQENNLRITRFTEDLYTKVRRKWSLERSIKRSLEDPAHGGFTVHYQPLVSTRQGKPVVAVEALARWMHPDHGAISPGEFIPIAEDLGIIDAIDNFVFNQALGDIDLFRKVSPDLLVHVNMSPKGSLATKLDAIRTTVAVHGRGKARSLVVEVTESALGQQPRQELLKATQRLRDTGIGLAVDDFGTGESNFDRVAELPFSEVKLARTFVDADHVMLAGLVHSFHSLGLTVVAENIEDADQLERMTEAHCDVIQGFYYSRPAEIDTVIEWIRDRMSSDLDALHAPAPSKPIG